MDVRRGGRFGLLAAMGLLAVLFAVSGVTADVRQPTAVLEGFDLESDEPVQSTADKMEYQNGGWAVGRGNVHIKRGNQELRADMVRFNTETGTRTPPGASRCGAARMSGRAKGSAATTKRVNGTR